MDNARNLADQSADEWAAFIAASFAKAEEALAQWSATVTATEPKKKLPRRYRKLWRKLTKESGYNFGFRKNFTSTLAG